MVLQRRTLLHCCLGGDGAIQVEDVQVCLCRACTVEVVVAEHVAESAVTRHHRIAMVRCHNEDVRSRAVSTRLSFSRPVGKLVKLTAFMLSATMALEQVSIGRATIVVAFGILFGSIVLRRQSPYVASVNAQVQCRICV